MSKYDVCFDGVYGFGDTLLAAVADARVFSIERVGDGTFRLTEGCDGWYTAALTRDQLRTMIAELTALADLTEPE